MKVVIDIPEDVIYKMNKMDPLVLWAYDVKWAIKDGISLPKGHGRLIDADELLKAMNTWDKFGYTETGAFVRNPQPGYDYVPYVHYEDMANCVLNSPTIVESDSRTQIPYSTDEDAYNEFAKRKVKELCKL